MANQNLNIQFVPEPSHGRLQSLTGRTFHYWFVLGFAGYRLQASGYKRARWWCRCRCGMLRIVDGNDLRSSRNKSCGCRPNLGCYIDGRTKTRAYRIWRGMWDRCTNPENKSFKYYGERGITVCDSWKEFPDFFTDMGEPPSTKHTLDRKDNGGNYEPDNCQWATTIDQANHKSSTRMITFQARTQPLAVWCRELHLSYISTYRRIFIQGWSSERALTISN